MVVRLVIIVVALSLFLASMAITDSLILRGAHLNGDYQLAEMHMHWGNNNSIGSEHAMDNKKRPAEVYICVLNGLMLVLFYNFYFYFFLKANVKLIR